MGLRDLLRKKKSPETDAGLVGGLTDTDWEADLQSGPDFGQESQESAETEDSESPAWPGFSGFPGQAREEEEGAEEREVLSEEQGPEQKESVAASLDIFSMETGEDEEGNTLARQLPAVDIHDLLRECHEMLASLHEGISC